MRYLDADTAAAYLRDVGQIERDDEVQVQRLAGGVSNEVLYVAFVDGGRADFVLKQARPQLRTPEPWFCGVERIWREVEVLRICQQLIERGTKNRRSDDPLVEIPRILFEERENYAFAMTAAPRQHAVWKQLLLKGEAEAAIAEQCGRLLAMLHGGSWRDAAIAERLADRQIFDQLRLDPYYCAVGKIDENARSAMDCLVASVWEHPRSLVHADFSPKNLLVYPAGLMMVDFETGHYGDPAFDLGFFLSHLVLKSFYRWPQHEPLLALTERFWEAYREVMMPTVPSEEYASLVARGIQNFAGCAWARIDGKSKVEYLLDSPHRDAIRGLCRHFLHEPPQSWDEVLETCRSRLQPK